MRQTLRKKEETGITLIALVITIIILLILAAVTIAALTGDNGILRNTIRGKQETEKAEILEQIRLDIYDELTENMGEVPDEEKITEIADRYGDIEGTNFEDKVLKTEKGNYEIKLSDIRVIEKEKVTAVKEIKPTDYGKYVNYNVDYDNDGSVADDWRIFYNDGENIYLISSEYVIPKMYENAQGGYKSLNLDKLGYGTVDSAIDFLKNKENWNMLEDTTKAEYALGGPTLEMYVSSWNQKHEDEIIYLQNGETGLLIGDKENPTRTEYSFSEKNQNDDLYGISQGTIPDKATNYMWIPSKMDNGHIMRGGKTLSSYENGTMGNITGNGGGWIYVGIRPIICLRTDVVINQGEGTIENPFDIYGEE